MKLEIKGISGHFIIWPPYSDGNVRMELHTDDGGMAAADFTPEHLAALWAGIQFKIEQQCSFPACPCEPGEQCACVVGSVRTYHPGACDHCGQCHSSEDCPPAGAQADPPIMTQNKHLSDKPEVIEGCGCAICRMHRFTEKTVQELSAPTVIKDFPGQKVEQQLRQTGALPGEICYTAMDSNILLEALADDASKWAAAFVQHARKVFERGDNPLDEAWLMSWFANAIEHSSDVRRRRSEPSTRPILSRNLQ